MITRLIPKIIPQKGVLLHCVLRQRHTWIPGTLGSLDLLAHLDPYSLGFLHIQIPTHSDP